MATIFENINNAISGVVGGFEPANFSDTGDDRADYAPENFNKNLGYSFRMLNVSNGQVWRNSEFTLHLNPQEITQDEIFAIQITPTQQGIITEHQGNIFKDLTIAGTTGMAPNVGMAGVSRSGKYRFGRGETGYIQFHKFRNFLRQYVEAKKDPENANLQLTFENPKDGELFIVEPLKFQMKRSKSSRMTYNYNIVFKVIGRSKFELDDNNILGWFEKLQLGSETAIAYIEDAEGLILGSTELLQKVSSDFANTILKPIEALGFALKSFSGANTLVLDIPRKTVSQLQSDIKTLRENAAEVVGIDLTSYNTLISKTSTTQTGVKQADTTYEDYLLLNALSKAEKAAKIVLSNNDFFGKKSLSEMSTGIVDAYDGKVSFPNTESARLSTVLGGDTVLIIASRELKDVRRFRELISINQLVPPYIDTSTSTGVLAPGSDILIPTTTTPDDDSLIVSNAEYPITQSLTPAERKLGIDLALDKNFDLKFTNVNDFDLIGGLENARQAIKLKLGYEKGSVKFHPEIGNKVEIGKKITSGFAFSLRQDLLNSILIDPRFDSASFDVSINGGTVTINGTVKPKNFNLFSPINLLIKETT